MTYTKTLFILAGCTAVIALGTVVLKPRNNNMDPYIRERSRAYIRTFSKRPIAELTTEQKLLLLHSYFNVKDYAATVKLGTAVIPELEKLPAERQKPFVQMLDAAYAGLGRDEKVNLARGKL